MQIGELAKSAGVTVQAVRFYERKGLLPSPPRKESGYRIYGEADVRRLQFVRQAKRLGFSLAEIQSILRMRDRGVSPCSEVVAMAEQHLAETEQQLNHLIRFRDELARNLSAWKRSKKHVVAGDAICALIERTIERTIESTGGNEHGNKKSGNLQRRVSGVQRHGRTHQENLVSLL
jgi:DNA-binding transcriptional MerR regulator